MVFWLAVNALGCSGDAQTTAKDTTLDAGTTASDVTAMDSATQEQEARAPSDPVEKHTDPMGIGQEMMPKSPEAAVDPLDHARFPEPGATSFESAKPDGAATTVISANTSTPVSGGNELSGTSTGALQSPAVVAPGASAMAAQREIVEADLVQVHGDVLYVLNRYRGLVLVDMSQPDQPTVLGRAPFQAKPVDMYVRDGKAYVVMSDYFVYWQFDADADPQGFHGSQLLVIDVQDPRRPKEVSSFKVEGEITDTRIVGDVLYAVSKRNPEYWRYDTQAWNDTTWVLSIDIADPSKIEQVDQKEFPGAANVIQVFETALSIAAIDPNYYLVDDANVQQTLITFVDISDAGGKIKVGDHAYVPGAVPDKFKMDLRDGVLRIVSANWYWQPNSAATLTLFDANDPSKLEQRAQIPLALDLPADVQGQVGATRFTDNALFENLCWRNMSAGAQSCRLDVYDLSDASAPLRAAAVPVDGAIAHFEARGDRLLSLGQRSYVPEPTEPAEPGPPVIRPQAYRTVMQVALFDISQLSATQRLASAELDEGARSLASSDYKAFKVLEDLDMLLLPLTWYESAGTPNTRTYQGAQIIDWTGDQLTPRGRIAQSSLVERAIAFKDRVLSISAKQLQVVDVSDRDQPKQTGNLFLVRNVVDAFSIGGYQVQLAVSEQDSSFRFYVLPFGEDDMQKSVAELDTSMSVRYAIRAGEIIRLVGFDPLTGEQLIKNADFSNPMQPRFRGEYRIPGELEFIFNGGCGSYCSYYDYFWSPASGRVLNNELLPITVREVRTAEGGRRYYKNQLRLIDLRDPDRPQLAQGSLDMPEWPFVNRVDHGNILYSAHTEPALDENGNPKQYHERYFLDRVDVSDPNAISELPKVNIPGRLVDIDASGKILYTVDYQWDDHGHRRNSLNVLELDGDTAKLTAVIPVGDEIGRARYVDREVWLTTAGYPWFGRKADSLDSRQPYTRLTRLRFDEDATLSSTDTHDVEGYHFNLLDVEDDRVFLTTSRPYGLLMLDTSDFADPKVLGASRTVGFVSKLIEDEDFLYMPMGAYGVRRVQAR